MKQITLIFIVVINLLILSDCESIKENPNSVKIIDVEKSITENSSINLQQASTSVDYIPLETNENCILGDAIEAIIINKHILVISKMSNPGLFLFDLDGKFIRKLGKRGKGPGEYGNIGSVSFDEHIEELLISTDSKNRIIKFKFDGSSSEGISLKSSIGFVYHNSVVYAHKPSFVFRGNNNDNKQLLVFNAKTGKIINSFHPVNIAKTKYIDMFVELPSFSIVDNNVYYFVSKEEIVYKLAEDSCVPNYQFQFGKYGFPDNYKWDYQGYNNARNTNKVRIESVFVSNSFLLCIVNQQGINRVMVYDKKNDKMYNSINNKTDYVPLTFIHNIYQNKIVSNLQVLELINSDYREKFPDKLKRILKSAKESNNPILRVVTLKK